MVDLGLFQIIKNLAINIRPIFSEMKATFFLRFEAYLAVETSRASLVMEAKGLA